MPGDPVGEIKFMGLKVTKFGGSSLADAAQFEKVLAILRADGERRIAVPSAPGKRYSADTKITDMLYRCQAQAANGEDFLETLNAIRARYDQIIAGLAEDAAGGCPCLDLSAEFALIALRLREGANADYCASRGEYLSGKVLAWAWNAEFIDAADIILFQADGVLDERATYAATAARLKDVERSVVPGFYGSLPGGLIKTFSRGGSDITGALVAWAAGADLYENWTDVDGVLAADPRIVADAATIDSITYRELRELSYMGATVLHEDAIFPVRKAGIPINIRNTNAPAHPGTMITAVATEEKRTSPVTGVAGRKGFSVINVEKAMMNSELGFGRRVLSVLENHGISFEHLPSGIDTLSVVVETAYLNEQRSQVLDDLFAAVCPDDVEIIDGLALVATVGRGMVRNPGTAARLFGALSQARINVRMIDQGSSELNIIVGVVIEDFEAAIAAIYREFVS